MSTFPTLKSGSVAKYPLTRGNKFRTNVATFTDLSEQRWSRGNGGLAMFSLVYNNIITSDKEILREFYGSTLGSFDSTWQLTLKDASSPHTQTTYYNLQFVPGVPFSAQETSPGIWRTTLQIRQTNMSDPPNVAS